MLEQVKVIVCGGYILKDSGGKLDIILIVIGLEMEIIFQVVEKLIGEGYNVCVVLLFLMDIFDVQDEVYCELVLLVYVIVCVVVEVGIVDYWYKYVGLKGVIIGMMGYGEFVLVDKLFLYFGFIVENIVEKVCWVLNIKG